LIGTSDVAPLFVSTPFTASIYQFACVSAPEADVPTGIPMLVKKAP
jgi:hypothetical protein